MRILIIEDEARIARRIERMIQRVFIERIKSVEHVESLTEGLDFLKNNEIDLLFLDLNLNGEDGFQVLESMVSEAFHTIIISAYKEKAIQAFEYGVLDFVPKPFSEERFVKACDRITNKSDGSQQIKYLSVKKKHKHILVPIENIEYLKGAGIYSEIILKSGKKEIHSKSLEALLVILPNDFVRLHKSYIAPISYIEQLLSEPGSKYSAILKSKRILPIGRTRYKDIKALLGQ